MKSALAVENDWPTNPTATTPPNSGSRIGNILEYTLDIFWNISRIRAATVRPSAILELKQACHRELDTKLSLNRRPIVA